MRYIDSTLKARLEKAYQTLYENANPTMNIWISRNSTPIKDPIFWEKTKIGDIDSISALSLAARRMDIRRQADRMYAACCKNGVGYIKYSSQTSDISKMIWVDAETITDAIDISIAFDGRMVKTIKGKVEFQTDSSPWVFWVTASGELYAKLLGSDYTLTLLTTENCTKVSTIRGIQSDVADFDQGLLVFFILDGAIYFRTLRSGIWEDAAPINFGPAVTWVDIVANRTWDYRIVIQAMDSNGKIYELFTYSQGIAKQNVERIEITDAKAASDFIPVTYIDTSEIEKIELANIDAGGQIIYALSPIPVRCENINDGTGEWGKFIEVEFDYPINNIEENAGNFVITDGNGVSYAGQTIEYADTDCKTIKIGYIDFNSAYGTNCSLSYMQGTVQGPAAQLNEFNFSFTPINLIPQSPSVPLTAHNDGDKTIIIKFDGNINSEDWQIAISAFTVTGYEYTYVPGGELLAKTYTIDSVGYVDENDKKIIAVNLNVKDRLKAPQGKVTVIYNQTIGNLVSSGGAIASFSLDFTPNNLTPIYNPNCIENIEIADLGAIGSMVRISYTNTKAEEKIEIKDISALGGVIHINDL